MRRTFQTVAVRSLWGDTVAVRLSDLAIAIIRKASRKSHHGKLVILDPVPRRPSRTKPHANAMQQVYGLKPGKTCEGCLFVTFRRFTPTNYFKCIKRGTLGARTDHRLSWDACGLYQPRLGAIEGVDGRSGLIMVTKGSRCKTSYV